MKKSIIIIIIDHRYSYFLHTYLPSYLFTTTALAKTILSTLAGSLFGMITVTFSTIMVVLTMYSSQFSPRTLQDFLRNKATLNVLGIFVGGFVYTILTLLFLQSNSGKIAISAVVGVVVAIICLGYFVYFIHHVANSMQVNILIDNLKKDIIGIIDKVELRNSKDENIKNIPPENLDKLIEKQSIPLYADKSGYLQFVYDIELAQVADKMNILLRAEKKIGDYVTENSKLFSVWYFDTDYEKLNLERLYEYVVIENERSKEIDIEFGLLKLTEVALRAISPGINDPNTAVFAINQLGWALSRIAIANIENTFYYNDSNRLLLIFEDKSFYELLYKTFYQLKYYGSQDVSIAGAILDALLIIAEGSPKHIVNKVWEFSDYVLDSFNKNVLEKEDKKYLNHKIYSLAIECEVHDKSAYFPVES